jgi:hypothetical protein
MQMTGAITIYHFSRRDGTALFIHPLEKPGTMLDITEDIELQGRYGQEPRVESVTMLRNELYRRIETDVRDWINERRFIPRFLIASTIFLIVYLFLAVVIRDPVPIVDELLIAAGTGIAGFFVVGRRFEQSRIASRRRVTLRAKVDGVVFSESPFVRDAEDLLHVLEALAPEDREYPPEATDRAAHLWAQFPAETSEVLAHLRQMVNVAPYRNLAREMRKGSLGRKTVPQVEQGLLVPAAVHLLYVLQEAR